jgi:hypothetical protein
MTHPFKLVINGAYRLVESINFLGAFLGGNGASWNIQ